LLVPPLNGLLDERQRIVEASIELRRDDVVAQRFLCIRHAVGQLQDEVALKHLLRDRYQFSDQCHGCCSSLCQALA
jgi:hypothetical protein